MSKNPFEKLLLTDEPLTPEEKAQASTKLEELAARLFDVGEDDSQAHTENPSEIARRQPAKTGRF